MAADGLITEYLSVLDGRLRTRRDRHDLLDEIADHLYSAVERLESLGIDRETAERRTLARFGEPRLVASLLTSVPSKGSTVSLFFSRHLGALSAVAGVLWAAAVVFTYYGYTALSGSWTSERYLTSAVVVGLACFFTVAVLIGLNVRAIGRVDPPTVAIAVIGLLAAFTGTVLSWVIVVWLPLMATAVTWTMLRARRAHAGSRTFATVLLVAMPLLAIASIVVPLVGVIADLDVEGGAWLVVAGVAVVLFAALIDIAVRLATRVRSAALTA